MRSSEKIVVIRPGALGDVLVIRGVLRFLRGAFPDSAITLIAPGERGRLFEQAGWVDRLCDWDGAEYAALFADNPGASPLPEVFAGCTRLISFFEMTGDAHSTFQRNIAEATPGAARLFSPSRPDAALGTPVGEWLLSRVRAFQDASVDATECLTARIPMPKSGGTTKTLIIHPGSGSRRKNWPVENYAKLANMLLTTRFSNLTITAGEADGELGECLQSLVLGSKLHPQGSLPELAKVIANAHLYIGNDSGVSHLASLVRSESGNTPKSAVIFGASNAKQWSPPGALILDAGEGMNNLPPEQAFSRIEALLS